VILEHLDDHRMGLIAWMTRGQSLVDLCAMESAAGPAQVWCIQRKYQNKRSPEILEHGNLLP